MGHSLERIRRKNKGEMLLGMNRVERWSRKVNIVLFKFIKFYCNVKPPEGGCGYLGDCSAIQVSFNTQPPEGGCISLHQGNLGYSAFQHTAARRRQRPRNGLQIAKALFQHTAARRRLPMPKSVITKRIEVSTHSRPKAAANGIGLPCGVKLRFNTQPPEGGCPSQN